jgi:hypothetical protein
MPLVNTFIFELIVVNSNFGRRTSVALQESELKLLNKNARAF